MSVKMTVKNRLPGVYFQTETPSLKSKLPRMDVTAFVGFAASGPIDVPVPVEDEVSFERIFGSDLQLAWDEAKGEMHYAYLAQTVRAFFLNGGRRCWVIRVADSDTASSNRYLIPGMMRLPAASGSDYVSVAATARSEGSWSDNLSVGTTLLRTPFRVVDFGTYEGQMYVQIQRASPVTLEAGDLLRLTFESRSIIVFFAVDSVESVGEDGTEPDTRVGGRAFWFSTQRETASPPEGETVAVRFLTWEGNPVTLTEEAIWTPSEQPGGEDRVYISGPLEQGIPKAGSLLELRFENGEIMLLSANQVSSTTPEEQQGILSPAGEEIVISGKRPLLPIEAMEIDQEDLTTVELLTLELWVRDSEGQTGKLSDLGFLGSHSRFLGDLPTDEDLFKSLEEVGPLPDGQFSRQSQLWSDVMEPRFPIAVSGNEDDVYLPIWIDGVLSPEVFTIPLDGPTQDTALERNGLTDFKSGLFLDSTLKDLGVLALETAAFHKRHILGHKLEKAHAVFPLEEVTLLSVPDAVHLGWERCSTSSSDALQAPILESIVVDDEENEHTVRWTEVQRALNYVLQAAADAQFLQLVGTYRVEGNSRSTPHDCHCPRIYFYRVRAERYGEISPWSNVLHTIVPRPDFRGCGERFVESPTILNKLAACSTEEASYVDDGYTIQWSSVDEAAEYILQESLDPAFTAPVELYQGDGLYFTVVRLVDKVYYYRVRAEIDGESSPWSRTLIIEPEQRTSWKMKNTDSCDEEELLEIHKALLQLSMARGDILSILSLPQYYTESEAVAYKRALVSKLGSSEEKPLSYGALYHPWSYLRTESGKTQLVPPDGIVSGSIAARAIARGAWIAPANEILRGVLTLRPAIGDQDWERLYDEQVNLVRRESRGFVLLSADTLSTNIALRPINVRRLLILLRRIALREGMALVFEPNNESFRDLVHQTFEAVLSDLYVRGAFAGKTPNSAYQVVTDSSVNPPSSLERGRFVVELKVAPSRPMAFITVRLVQGEDTGLIATEV